MNNRTVDAIVLGTSLFASVALLGAAVSAFDPNQATTAPGGLVGAPARLAPAPIAATPPLDPAAAEKALDPFVPDDAHDHTAVAPTLGDAGSMDGGHTHGSQGDAALDDHGSQGHGHDEGAGMGPSDDQGHDHGGDADNAMVLADGDDWKGGPFEGQRIQWEPAGDNRGAAMRYVDEADTVHLYSPSDDDCAGVAATQAEVDYGSALVNDTRVVLEQYHNRPDLALADGFVPYPLGNRYWHMINFSRLRTSTYTPGADSEVLNPAGLESFIYGMVDGKGLYALGGMYMYDQKDAVPPAPFGCLTAWHMHVGSQGFVTSFDASDPRSVWMVHVWNLDVVGPWGEHDGSHASDWWVGWRYIPNACANDDCF